MASNVNRWTSEELNLLKEIYLVESKEMIMEKLPNRTWKAIKSKGQKVTNGGGRSKNPHPAYEYNTINDITHKKCRECGEFYPMDVNHYHKKCDTKDGFHNICKKCRGYEFTPYVKEGYCICKKCNRELPWTYQYFPVIRKEKNPRQVCRECNDKYDGFLDEDATMRKWWSKEEEELFINRYPHYTNEELRNKFYNDMTDKQLSDKAWQLGISKTEETYWRGRKQQAPKVSEKLKGVPKTEEHKKKVSETKKRQFAEGIYVSHWKGRIVSEEEKEKARLRVKGRWSGRSNPRYKNPLYGKENGRWQGGITNISTALRENIYEWKQQSMEMCKFKCLLTGGEFNVIHHLTPFNSIIKESVNELNLEIKSSLGEYSENDRDNLINLVQLKHKEYGLGVCLNKDLHKLFHDKFSYNDFTIENFKVFIENYFNGIYDNELDDKLKSINSKTSLKEVKKLASFYYGEI